jgi:hypothetical protein
MTRRRRPRPPSSVPSAARRCASSKSSPAPTGRGLRRSAAADHEPPHPDTTGQSIAHRTARRRHARALPAAPLDAFSLSPHAVRQSSITPRRRRTQRHPCACQTTLQPLTHPGRGIKSP